MFVAQQLFSPIYASEFVGQPLAAFMGEVDESVWRLLDSDAGVTWVCLSEEIYEHVLQ